RRLCPPHCAHRPPAPHPGLAPLSLHDALPIYPDPAQQRPGDYTSELWVVDAGNVSKGPVAKVKTRIALRSQVHGTWVSRDKLERSEEHTSELQSRENLVCRLLLEQKNRMLSSR